MKKRESAFSRCYGNVVKCSGLRGLRQPEKKNKTEENMGYENRLKSKAADDLFEAMLTLETQEECYKFFEDLCTVKEIKAMSQRFEVAKLLIQKKTYSEIEDSTGASTATISRINRTLQFGADGYTAVLERLKAKEEASE